MLRAVELVANYEGILKRVAAAASRPVTLVAVSKLKPASDIAALYAHGVRHFGENYVNELVTKAAELPSDIKWHFIGSLQSNKCKELAKIPNLYAVETVDSVKKVRKLQEARAAHGGLPINVYLQINTSGEDNKSGLSVANVDETLEVARAVVAAESLVLAGLMTIGLIEQSKREDGNSDFARLVKLAGEVEAALGVSGLELSMGMSSDFEEAIAQGSTSVRVGSDIFGSRPPKV